MRKSLTLVELLISVALMGVIILGAFAFENASRKLLRTSERKVDVLNDLTFVMEHFHKNVLFGIGDITAGNATVPNNRMALNLSENGGVYTLTVWQDTNQDAMLNTTDGSDVQVQYVFDPSDNVNRITFRSDASDPATEEVLAENFVTPSEQGNAFGISLENGGVRIQNMSMIFDLDRPYDPSDNPQLEIREQYFFPLSQSLS
jgi:hypothetical protein